VIRSDYGAVAVQQNPVSLGANQLNSSNSNKEARLHLLAQSEALAERIFRFVAPLAVPDRSGDYPEAAGSLVLLKHLGRTFLVTAAHNLDNNPGCTFYLGTATEWIEVPSGFFATNEKQTDGKSNRFDYAVLEADANFVAQLDGLDFLSAMKLRQT